MLVHLYDRELSDRWFNAYWPVVPGSLCVFYLLIIFVLKRWMDKREAIKPKAPLIVWNTCLAVFSVAGVVKFTPSGLLDELASGGFVHSVCLIKPFSTQTLTLWMSLFAISKFVEFGDTIFLVLRKAPLTFLHVYHHVTVALYTWHGGTSRSSAGHWFVSMNFAVHSFMYIYFSMKGFGVNIPSVVAKAITSLQLLQFFIGLVCVAIAAGRLWVGEVCNSAMDFTLFGLVIYGSYLILFLNFFYHRYVKQKPKKTD